MKYKFFSSCLGFLLLIFVCTSCSPKKQVEKKLKEVVEIQKVQPVECTVSGRVMFGPVRPVERNGMPKPNLSKWYKGRSVLIFSANTKRIVVQLPLNKTGKYECHLAPGNYIIDMKLRIPERATGLPKHITLAAGEALNFDINIDTGLQ